MSDFCRFHGLPRAGIDPITDPATALTLLMSMADFPLTPQVVAIVADSRRIGHAGLVVHGAESPDSVLEVVDRIRDAVPESGVAAASEVLLVSIRPDGRLDERDGDRWLEMCDLLEERHVGLLEWFVVTGAEAICPRDLLGVPSRWGHRAA